MLSFLSPSLLWALPLAATPVVLHLIFMRRARRLPFSDLTLLRQAYLRSLPATRLRQWLLMLVRCMALAALIMAFARPVLHRAQANAEGSESGLDVAVLLDVSWSMGAARGGKPTFERAAAAASDLIRRLRPADRVAVAAFSDRLEAPLAWSSDAASAAAALSRLRVGSRGGDVAPPLSAAYSFFASTETASSARRARKVIAVLSDNTAQSLRSLPASGLAALPGYDPDVAVVGLSWTERVDNAGILQAGPCYAGGDCPGSEPGSEREDAALTARAALFGEARASGLDLWLRERRVESRAVRLEPGAQLPVKLRLPTSNDPDLWGRLELRRDALPADDVFYFSLQVQARPRVLLAHGGPESLKAGKGGFFLKELLGEGRRLPYRVDMADAERLDQVRLEDYAAVILADFGRLPAGAPAALERYVIRGGGLWIVPGARSEDALVRDMGRLLPGRLGPATDGSRGMVPAEGAAADSKGPFSWNEFELANITVARRFALEPSAGSAVWFVDGAGAPLLAGASLGAGRVLLWASTFDIEWTNLALKPAFAALGDAALRDLSGYAGKQLWRTLRVDEPIVRVWGAGEPAPARVQVSGPGGRRTVLLVHERRVEYDDTREPGLYFLTPLSGSAASRSEAYAVNLDRAGGESDLSPAARPPWTPLRTEALWEEFLRAVYGRDVRSAVLGIVALLLVLESLLSRPRGSGAVSSAAPSRSLEKAA